MTNDAEKTDLDFLSFTRSATESEGHDLTDDGFEYSEFSDSEEEEWWREDETNFDCEMDLEEHEYSTFGDMARTVKIRLSLTSSDKGTNCSRWMINFIVECTCDGVTAANALARYIHREGMRSEFWERMERPSEETCHVAFQVFDRYGDVKAKYKDHPVQRGSGVWGNELDHGPLFLIEKLHVTALELRRKGLGKEVVSLLLKKAKKFCLDERGDARTKIFSAILMGPLNKLGQSAEERLMIRGQAQFGAIHFWRACGFRRIGASRSFAFSFDLQHQSRALSAASDFDPRRDCADDLEDEKLSEAVSFIEPKRLKLERLRDVLPLHHAALTLPDEDLQSFFVAHIDVKIGWNQVTNSEATLLHLTACELKPMSTRWLLENVQLADSWKTARDIDGYTPLEALQEKLEIMRTQGEVRLRVFSLSDQFRGYPDTAVSCLSLLSRHDTLVLNEACLRYGCKCGECLEGYLSARMRSSLIFQGETKYDLIQDGIDDGDFWISDNDYILVHLDRNVRESLGTDKSLRKGFVNIFRVAVECLKAKRVPTTENLEWCCNNQTKSSQDTQNYLRHAGTQKGCRAVLRYLFDATKEEDEKAGDGECQYTLKEDWSDLPPCRNDHEFEFVARACGYGGDDFISLPWW
ncbi:uncharacterized protein N7483_002598 [Penicillium malachiteum]|uniref:uncharacterized protein n=1 Tax=Penicillium malachiteum TaxID=1324776 RepID=UPI0025479C7A|nr:uncharacterized protein N7483_002598 [Penicillium malachiteum]KAJ5737473.1 hypothetical protein N7483_002598 [Penicillium malachiteum]